MRKVFLSFFLSAALLSCKKSVAMKQSDNLEQVAKAVVDKSFIDGEWLTETSVKYAPKESNRLPYVTATTTGDSIFVVLKPWNGHEFQMINIKAKVISKGDTIKFLDNHNKENSFIKMPNGDIRFYFDYPNYSKLIPFNKKYSEE